MRQMRNEVRPFTVHSRTPENGRSRILAECPFCEALVTIYLWSFAGSGKKRCKCGAMFYNRSGGESHKLVEISS